MQKGNDSARSAHIALNSINVALFAWQIVMAFRSPSRFGKRLPALIKFCEEVHVKVANEKLVGVVPDKIKDEISR